MERRIALVTLVVRDYAEAVAFYVGKLGFELTEDRVRQGDKRWVVVTPTGGSGTGLLLAKATGQRQDAVVGDQGGGRVSFFLHTTNFDGDYQSFIDKGVRFYRAASPRNLRDGGSL